MNSPPLSQMLICTAQLRAQRHSACMWCKKTWAGTPSPMLLGFCARCPGVDVTRRRGQRVPLRRRHGAEPLTAVGSRCSEVTGTGLLGRRHSALQGLQPHHLLWREPFPWPAAGRYFVNLATKMPFVSPAYKSFFVLIVGVVMVWKHCSAHKTCLSFWKCCQIKPLKVLLNPWQTIKALRPNFPSL